MPRCLREPGAGGASVLSHFPTGEMERAEIQGKKQEDTPQCKRKSQSCLRCWKRRGHGGNFYISGLQTGAGNIPYTTNYSTRMGHGVHCFSGGTIVVRAQELRVHWGLCMLWCKVRAGWLTGHRRPGQRAMKEGLAFWKVPEANTSVLTSVANQPPQGP